MADVDMMDVESTLPKRSFGVLHQPPFSPFTKTMPQSFFSNERHDAFLFAPIKIRTCESLLDPLSLF
jgi:hypothetical protein